MSRIYVPDGLTKEMLVNEISNVFLQYSAVVTDSNDSGEDEVAGNMEVELSDANNELSMPGMLDLDLPELVDEFSIVEQFEDASSNWLSTPHEVWIKASDLFAKSIDLVD